MFRDIFPFYCFRATASNNNSSSNNGNFGFGNSVNSFNDQDSDFADFSSAFGGNNSSCDNNTNKTDQNLFGTGIPAPPSPKEATAGGDFDLFGGAPATGNANPTPNSGLGDLLGGFGGDSGGSGSLTSMPNLMSAPPAGNTQPSNLFGGPTSLIGISSSTSNSSLPPLQPTSTINPFPHQPNPSALIDSPVLAPTQQGGANNMMPGAAMTTNDQQPTEKKLSNLPSTWNDVKGLNMDLANFSLSNPTQKKAAMSMNAMKTISQSSSKSPSPLSPMGKGGFPAPAAPALKPQQPSGGSFDLL